MQHLRHFFRVKWRAAPGALKSTQHYFVMQDVIADLDDALLFSMPIEILQRKKDKIVKKGSRIIGVGKFGIYVFNGKKVLHVSARHS
jgi:hypothetical protein